VSLGLLTSWADKKEGTSINKNKNNMYLNPFIVGTSIFIRTEMNFPYYSWSKASPIFFIDLYQSKKLFPTCKKSYKLFKNSLKFTLCQVHKGVDAPGEPKKDSNLEPEVSVRG